MKFKLFVAGLIAAFFAQDVAFNYQQLNSLRYTEAYTQQMLRIQYTEVDRLKREKAELLDEVAMAGVDTQYYQVIAATITLYCRSCMNQLQAHKIELPAEPTEGQIEMYTPMFLQQTEALRGNRTIHTTPIER
jgi:hypothetical protein